MWLGPYGHLYGHFFLIKLCKHENFICQYHLELKRRLQEIHYIIQPQIALPIPVVWYYYKGTRAEPNSGSLSFFDQVGWTSKHTLEYLSRGVERENSTLGGVPVPSWPLMSHVTLCKLLNLCFRSSLLFFKKYKIVMKVR